MLRTTLIASIASLAVSKSASDSTRITYFVKQQPKHVKHLLDTLQEVSDPRNDKYGQCRFNLFLEPQTQLLLNAY